jgi:hypothetical protein
MDCFIKIAPTLSIITNTSTHSLRSLGKFYGRISLYSKAALIKFPIMWGVSCHLMNLIRRYTNFLDDAHIVLTELLIMLPACIVGLLLIPGTELNSRLIVSGVISCLITGFHLCLGIYSLSKRRFWSCVNLICLPIALIVLVFVII